MSRVIITGAGGFVCSHLATGLHALGFTPTLIDTHFDTPTRQRLELLPCIESDLQSVTALPEADVFIHGAAITASPAELGVSYAEYLSLHSDLTFAALRLAQRSGAKRFVFLSSAGVFLPEQTPPLTEQTPADNTSAYGTAKRMTELALQGVREHSELQTVSVRLGNLYGPSEAPRSSRPRVSVLQRFINAAQNAQPLQVETPDAQREWTYIKDLAPAITALLELTELPACVHLANPEVIADAALAAFVADAFARGSLKSTLELNKAPRPVRPPFLSVLNVFDAWTPFEEGFKQSFQTSISASHPAVRA